MRILLILKAFLALMLPGVAAGGLEPLGEEEMSSVTGEGIAIGLQDIRARTSASSRFEIIGADAPAGSPFERADARWYGFTLSDDDAGTSFVGPCGSGIDGLGCPIGGAIDFFAPFDNPYILRAFDYEGIDFEGDSVDRTVLELLGPTEHDPYRYSAWTEFVSGGEEVLQGQAILANARLFRTDDDGERHNSKIRILSHTDPDDPTIAFNWHNHWQGDFRFSLNQTFASQDEEAVPPIFGDVEGFYARDVEVFMPLGHMFYQSIILDNAGEQDGNFRIEVTRPNSDAPTAYLDFYSTGSLDGYDRLDRPDRYDETHGFFRIGDWTPPTTCDQGGDGAENCLPRMGGSNNPEDSTDSGMFFVAHDQDSSGAEFNAFSRKLHIVTGGDLRDMDADSDEFENMTYDQDLNQVNLGDSRIEGMLIQHMELRTRGAAN